MMTRVPVQSSIIFAIGYDPETRTMEIDFKTGAVYQYEQVPPELHKDFMESSSKGTFFHFNFKKGKFPYKKL